MPAKKRVGSRPFPIVGLGASAGGMEALLELFKEMPERPGLAFIVVQHLDPTHESLLSALLAKSTSLPVREARDGEKVQPDQVYVIPPNAALTIAARTLKILPRRDAEGRRQRLIDQFFASLARESQESTIAVLLSGTGTDGVAGMEAVKAEGGFTMAQDEASAKHPEMPRGAVQAGCVDLVLRPSAIAKELIRIGSHPYVVNGGTVRELERPAPDGSGSLARLFATLRKQTQVDFSFYKRPTLRRRIARRMALHKLERLSDYAAYVEDNPKEAEALYQDMLIKVTGFFRDPGAFTFLKGKLLPAMVKSRAKNAPLRIWVPGCATGEEAYSIAICAVEYLNTLGKPVPCQIFATDLSESAVERARAGFYPDAVAQDVSSDRLRRFFTKVDGGYQISKMIRDMCVIARQDLVKDPPFSKLDLISCRNVLIYLEPAVHRKIFPLFHYSLRPGGYLMLGTSETVGNFGNLFGLLERKYKIYQRRPASVPVQFEAPPALLPAENDGVKERAPAPVREADAQREIDRLLLARYTPAGVVVNSDSEILQFRGNTERYLHPSPGKASLNLLKMVREGMLFEVRSALQKARREGGPVRSQPVQVSHEGQMMQVQVEVVPLRSAEPRDRQFLVLFNEAPGPSSTSKARGRDKVVNKKVKELASLVEQMKQELAGTKEHLQSIIEEQETTNEELKSANEEILSSNEELQSTNEELETAKEELQSTNEELTTLNEELQVRNAELVQVNNDILNLLGSVNIPIVMLGNDLRIRRFTPPAEKVLNILSTDVGRPVTDIQTGFDTPGLGALVAESIENVTTVEREVKDRHGRPYLMRVRPYMTRDKKIDGAVLILFDLDAPRKTS